MYDTRLGLLLAGGSLLLMACGCGGPSVTSQRSYVVDVFIATAELTDAGELYGKAMEPWFLGGEFDPDAARSALAQGRKIAARVRTKIEARNVPEDDRCRAFSERTAEYLAFQDRCFVAHERWLGIAEAENPAKLSKRRSVSQEIAALNEQELEWKRELSAIAEEIGVRTPDDDSD